MVSIIIAYVGAVCLYCLLFVKEENNKINKKK